MWASGVGRRTGTLGLRTVTAAGTSGDGQHSVRWLPLSLYFRPNGVLVLYWEQRAWGGQSAAVAQVEPGPQPEAKGARDPNSGRPGRVKYRATCSWLGQLAWAAASKARQGGPGGCEGRVRHGGSWRLSRQSGAAQLHWHQPEPGVAGSGKRRPGYTIRRSPCLQERALTLATRLELPPGWSSSSKDAAACPTARQEPAPACCPRRPIAQVRSLCASTTVSTQVPDRNLQQRTPSPSLQDSAQRS
jgi:hypothetical protein